MKDHKQKQNPKKPQNRQILSTEPDQKNHQELYLEHLMQMTVGVLDSGFQKG